MMPTISRNLPMSRIVENSLWKTGMPSKVGRYPEPPIRYGIDARIDFGRNFFESSSLLWGKGRSDSFGQVSALQGEIGLDLCKRAARARMASSFTGAA
jgi:hypothetical protein